jgi:transposase-like protein
MGTGVEAPKEKAAMKKGQTRRPAVIDAGDRRALTEFLTRGGQLLLPLVDLLERSQCAIDEVIDVVGRAAIEAVLELSAQQVAGAKIKGQWAHREIYWYGRQQGEVVLSDRKLKVRKPRLRRRGVGSGGEVEIPAYVRLREGGLGEHVVRLLMRGVSTRNYAPVLRKMADSAGVSKSQISREWIEASSAHLEALEMRRFDELDLLIVYVDGMQFGDHHVLAAVGVDRTGAKHVLGVAPGSSENYHVAKDLLCGIIERGLDPRRLRLFVIDGSKALRKAIKELFGSPNPVQRCRTHKLRNVSERLPREKRADVAKVMRAAYRLEPEEGMKKLESLAVWLERDGHGDAANSLREGMEETFTVNRLGLPSTLTRCLCTTNVIENPNGGVRTRTRRVTRWQDATMVLRWSATALLECEKNFRRIMGHRDLWILDQKLQDLTEEPRLAAQVRAA